MKKILFALAIVCFIGVLSCSKEEQTQGKVNTSQSFSKEGDSLKEGDTLPEGSVDFKAAEEFRKKSVIDEIKLTVDTTVVEVNSVYGRATIVCRQANTFHSNDFGDTHQAAHGCLYSNGVLYEYTWWPDHYVTTNSGGIFFVAAGSRYVVNSSCHC